MHCTLKYMNIIKILNSYKQYPASAECLSLANLIRILNYGMCSVISLRVDCLPCHAAARMQMSAICLDGKQEHQKRAKPNAKALVLNNHFHPMQKLRFDLYRKRPGSIKHR